MRITITDSSVIHIETTDGISINMFVETAAVLYKTLGPILDACGHGNRALEAVEAGQPAHNSTKVESVTPVCGHLISRTGLNGKRYCACCNVEIA